MAVRIAGSGKVPHGGGGGNGGGGEGAGGEGEGGDGAGGGDGGDSCTRRRPARRWPPLRSMLTACSAGPWRWSVACTHTCSSSRQMRQLPHTHMMWSARGEPLASGGGRADSGGGLVAAEHVPGAPCCLRRRAAPAVTHQPSSPRP